MDGIEANERTVAGIYTHLHEVWSIVPCRLVGWMAFWGALPYYLLRKDIADCQDPNAWYNVATWREMTLGMPSNFAIRPAEAIVEPTPGADE